MSIKISDLELSLFKGFKKTKVRFDPGLNLLVGANNSGKSSLLQAIYLAFDLLKKTEGISHIDKKSKGEKLRGTTVKNIPIPFHDDSYVSQGLKRRSVREKGTKIKITLQDNVHFLETLTFPGGNLLVICSNDQGHAGEKSYQEKIEKVSHMKQLFPLLIPSFSGVSATEEIKREEIIDYYIATGKSNEVLRNQLKNMKKERLNRLNKYLASNFAVEITEDQTKEIFLSTLFKETDNNLDISSGGSGFQQILQMLVFILSSDSDTILIDEPDAHLHYKLQHKFFDILLELAADGKQIIVATHSQTFIKKAIENNNRLVIVDKSQEEQKALTEYSDDVTELYRKGLVDESDIAGKSTAKIIFLEDANGGIGFRVLKGFFKKLGVNEPEYHFHSSQDVGKNVHAYIKGKQNIDGVQMRCLEIRDSDSLDRDKLDALTKKESTDNLQVFFIGVHEVENYLINASAICKALRAKDVATVTTAEVESLIAGVVHDTANRDVLLDALREVMRCQLEQSYRLHGIAYKDISTYAESRAREIRERHATLPYPLWPGKELLGMIRLQIHRQYHVQLSEIDIAEAFAVADIPEEIKALAKSWTRSVAEQSAR